MYNYRQILANCAGLVIFLVCCSPVLSQQNLTSTTVQGKLETYYGNANREQVYLHTDKEFYVAGEILWFKIYYTNASSGKPMQLSRIAYVEILNTANEPALQAKIDLQPGKANGSFYLPASLPTGNYIIRAYTNWMKNFDPVYFFEKKITIVNTIRNPETAPVADSLNADLHFYPEGGNLIGDIKSKIGFMAMSGKGIMTDYTGYITDQNNDTVGVFQPSKFGLGQFELLPEKGKTYKATAILPGGVKIVSSMPAAQEFGYAMKLENAGQNVKVTVKTKKPPGAASGESVLLICHGKQQLKAAQKGIVTNNDSLVFVIDKQKLGKGLNYFTLFDSKDQPVAERLFFIRPSTGIVLNLKSDRATYENRQLINVSMSTDNAVTDGSQLDLSASVVYSDSLLPAGFSGIATYFWLTSELPGTIESPEYYFSGDPGVDEATENLLLTYGWRRFRWDDILKGNNAFVKYPPEINGHIITALITDTRNDKPVAGAEAYLSIPGRPFGLYTSKSDGNGLLYFETKNHYGNGQIIAQPGIMEDSFYKVEVLSPFREPAIQGKKYSFSTLSETMKDRLLEKSIAMQVQNIYSSDSLRVFSPLVLRDTLPFYGLPETEYKLDDYQRFTTMEEVLREYVREVGVGLRNQRLIFKIFNPIAHDFYEDNSLVMIDGVPLSNPHKIFDYDPLKVRKIDVIRNRYFMGNAAFNGLASFTTYDGGFTAFELDPKLVAIDYAGLQMQREFYSPVYATKEQQEKRIPDFRNTLFWNPVISIRTGQNASLKFYSSDLKGKYNIIVQGMSNNGQPVFGVSTFEVK
jgi:hypothetical protein